MENDLLFAPAASSMLDSKRYSSEENLSQFHHTDHFGLVERNPSATREQEGHHPRAAGAAVARPPDAVVMEWLGRDESEEAQMQSFVLEIESDEGRGLAMLAIPIGLLPLILTLPSRLRRRGERDPVEHASRKDGIVQPGMVFLAPAYVACGPLLEADK